MKFYKLGVNADEYLKCNQCGRKLTEEVAYLTNPTDCADDELIDVFCKTCKETWEKRDRMILC